MDSPALLISAALDAVQSGDLNGREQLRRTLTSGSDGSDSPLATFRDRLTARIIIEAFSEPDLILAETRNGIEASPLLMLLQNWCLTDENALPAACLSALVTPRLWTPLTAAAHAEHRDILDALPTMVNVARGVFRNRHLPMNAVLRGWRETVLADLQVDDVPAVLQMPAQMTDDVLAETLNARTAANTTLLLLGENRMLPSHVLDASDPASGIAAFLACTGTPPDDTQATAFSVLHSRPDYHDVPIDEVVACAAWCGPM